VTNPLFEQFQHWIKQLESDPQTAFTTQLAQWQQWVSKFHAQADELSPHHADLVRQLSDYSIELVDLLADLTRAKARGLPIEELVERLRRELHQFNLKQTLNQATVPHQLLGLLFTQQQASQLLTEEQLSQFKRSTEQLSHPRFSQLKALIDALIDWTQASARVNRAMEEISTRAVEAFHQQVSGELEQGEILELWVSCYDQSYREAFNDQELQQAQAELVNNLAHLQLRWQALVDQFAEQLGLPSRSQLDQLIEQFDQQRRRIRQLEADKER
jgi:hypothetical protein